MKKVSTFNYTKANGMNIEVKVTRIYGNENTEVSLDGDKFQTSEFKDSAFVEVTISGPLFGHENYCTNPICEEKGMNGMFIYVAREKGASRRNSKQAFLALEDAWAEEINAACSEILTEDVDPEIVKEVESVKAAIERGQVLPAAELKAKRNEYRQGMLEGGEGFNPYDYYTTQEHVDSLKAKYPKFF